MIIKKITKPILVNRSKQGVKRSAKKKNASNILLENVKNQIKSEQNETSPRPKKTTFSYSFALVKKIETAEGWRRRVLV